MPAQRTAGGPRGERLSAPASRANRTCSRADAPLHRIKGTGELVRTTPAGGGWLKVVDIVGRSVGAVKRSCVEDVDPDIANRVMNWPVKRRCVGKHRGCADGSVGALTGPPPAPPLASLGAGSAGYFLEAVATSDGTAALAEPVVNGSRRVHLGPCSEGTVMPAEEVTPLGSEVTRAMLAAPPRNRLSRKTHPAGDGGDGDGTPWMSSAFAEEPSDDGLLHVSLANAKEVWDLIRDGPDSWVYSHALHTVSLEPEAVELLRRPHAFLPIPDDQAVHIVLHCDGSSFPGLGTDGVDLGGWACAIEIVAGDRAFLHGVIGGPLAADGGNAWGRGTADSGSAEMVGVGSGVLWALKVAASRRPPFPVSSVTVVCYNEGAQTVAAGAGRWEVDLALESQVFNLCGAARAMAPFATRHVDGHKGDPWNTLADGAAKAFARFELAALNQGDPVEASFLTSPAAGSWLWLMAAYHPCAHGPMANRGQLPPP